MQNWKQLYKELAEKINDNIETVRWIDLWHNQVNFLTDEHPFPTPAVFLNFRSNSINDTGLKVQQLNLQVDVYVYYETFLDTFKGAYNEESALGFLDLLNDVYALLHGTSGASYSGMRRTAFNPVDTGGAGNLYLITFECALVDYSAQPDYDELSVDGINIERGEVQRTKPDFSNGYNIP